MVNYKETIFYLKKSNHKIKLISIFLLFNQILLFLSRQIVFEKPTVNNNCI